jgi:GNAT superfamily N-acetyltransferase
VPVGFASAIAYPSGSVKNAWRGHRTVVLPDFQGFGMGVKISDAVAEMFHSNGCRYFSKTAHPRMGQYREASPLWKATSKNKKARNDYNAKRNTKENGHKMKHAGRMCFSHEYIGAGHE